MSYVKNEVYIDTVFIDEEMLKLIFERWHKVPKIILCNWKIEISDQFSIASILSYKITHLDLYCTSADNDDLISILASALSNTNIVHTLKYIHVRNSWYPKDEVQQEFNKLGFDLKVDGSSLFPEEMEE